MQKLTRDPLTKDPMLRRTNREPLSLRLCGGCVQSLWILLLASMMTLSACGGGTSTPQQQSAMLSGNWQFTMANPDPTIPPGTQYGLQGGFLLQKNGSVTGQAVYSLSGKSLINGAWAVCDSGSATITGMISGQTVNLTAAAGSQTFSLTGTLGSDGSITNPTFTTTGGTAVGFTNCGMATTTGTMSWTSVPPLTGSITGSFHSTGNTLRGQDFPVTGVLTQGENIGASNATVTGTLSFIDPTTLLSDYPCLATVSVNGQISGNTVVLQLIGTDGSNDGQIGIAASQANVGGNGAYSVTFDSTPNGYVLHSVGTAYVVNTKACPDTANGNFEDVGYICLALNSTTACQQPITLSPAVLTFPPQLLGSTNPSTQTITLTNIQPSGAAPLTGLTLTWTAPSGAGSDSGQTDFTNLPNFTEADTCAVPTGSTFSLPPGQSCTITVSFAPQESCTWLPNQGGTPPAQCPLTLSATLTVNNVPSVDDDKSFTAPITGTGVSFIQPSTPELDFGAEAFSEASLPQLLYFTNNSATLVQILPPKTCVNTRFDQFHTLPHPLVNTSPVSGLQVVSDLRQDVNNSTIDYSCDFDIGTNQSNFQISADTCSGTVLEPQAACSLEIAFVPQSLATYFSALDYFLELNTVQCTDPVNDPPSQSNPCEIDGGRFPVELRANITSPLRMSPGAGLDFGNVPVGKSSVTQTVTLLNDPSLTNPPTVNFVGKVVVSGNYSETDDCPYSLAPGGSCTLTITFKPKAVGHDPGTIAINYTTSSDSNFQTQPIYLRGTGQ